MGAFYINSADNFLLDTDDHVVGQLTRNSSSANLLELDHKQTKAWYKEIGVLKAALANAKNHGYDLRNWSVLLEYPIARRDKRIDAVIIAQSELLIIEHKSNIKAFKQPDVNQLLDYCLDLSDFHYESRSKAIVPILLCPKAKPSSISPVSINNKTTFVYHCDEAAFLAAILEIAKRVSGSCDKSIDLQLWNNSKYVPTPTIIEAAKSLFAKNSVKEFLLYHAGKKNLSKTTSAVFNTIQEAKQKKKKVICFITGVPGAGKTIAGLSIAHHTELQDGTDTLATFLSGNGPLIKVLKAALVKDSKKRTKKATLAANRDIVFIENVHSFFKKHFEDKASRAGNRIVIFDEAQRAWNAEHSEKKFERPFSEAFMMLDIMNRYDDWAVVVALIGGGQEINTGEAGLREWGKVLVEKFPEWAVHVSPELKVGDHVTGNLTLFEKEPTNINVVSNSDLHLDVSIRSYKAESLSKWVQLVLDNDPENARNLFTEQLGEYEMVITRDLNLARKWLKEKCLGSRRMGLVASSGGRRLRAHGIEVKIELDEANWFLKPHNDVRSSNALEIPATEFGIQGLELDWVGVCWDADLRRENRQWLCKKFLGSNWIKTELDQDTKMYILNKYRVLLTRARQGMVIWVPEGSNEDKTRCTAFYDPIFEYLTSCGIPELS